MTEKANAQAPYQAAEPLPDLKSLDKSVHCIGCGALVPESDGPAHRYVGASPGCWDIFGRVQVRGYEDARFGLGQIGVDAYMAQHPGTPSPQSTQSVTVHLISLCLQLEHGYSSDQAREALVQAVRYKTEFVWLDPPPSLGPVTILDVHDADDPATFKDVVRGWAQSVWQAWQPYHDGLREWAIRLDRFGESRQTRR